MKFNPLTLLITTLLLLSVAVTELQGQNGSIELHIKNIDYRKSGRLHIWLFNQSDYYQLPEKSALHRSTPVVSREFQQTFPNIPSGEYVIVALQDLNNNEKLDFEPVIHYAKEPIGFSKIQPWLMHPTYKQCQFKVESGQPTQIIVRLNKGFLLAPLRFRNKNDQ